MATDDGSLHPVVTGTPNKRERRSPAAVALWLAAGVLLVSGLFALNRDATPHELRPPAPLPHPAAPAPPAFPLRVSSTGRYLVDQNSAPFRLKSEAAWIMSTRATATQVDTYLADRKSRGFNAFILMNIVRATGGGVDWPTANKNGDAPFNTADDFSTPNDAYFNFIELIIDKAAAQGFAVELFYAYAGYQGQTEGWWTVVNQAQNNQAVCFAFGQYLGNRFKGKTNLIWMAGGDYTMPPGEGLTRMHKILEGIRSTGASQLAGSEWSSPDSLVTDQTGFTYGTSSATSDLQLDTFYGQGPSNTGRTYDTANRSWSRSSPILPGIMEEPNYTYSTYNPGLSSARKDVRKYEHWALTSGALGGSVWGIDGVWQWSNLSAMSDAAVDDQQRLFALYDSFDWWLLRPSGTGASFAGRDLVASGGGSGDSKITSAITSDGATLIAYVPPTGTGATTFSVDLRSMSGSSRARWWNPVTGTYTDITGGSRTLANTLSSQSFTSPGDNGTGTNDWMLVLDAGTGGNPPGTGGSPSTGGNANAGGNQTGAGGNQTGAGGAVSAGGASTNAGGAAAAGTAGSTTSRGGSAGSVSGGAGGSAGRGTVAPGQSGGARGAGAASSASGRTGAFAGSNASAGTDAGASFSAAASAADEGSCSCRSAAGSGPSRLGNAGLLIVALLLLRRRSTAAP